MKKILGSLVMIALLTNVSFAQNDEFKSVISLGAGFTLGGALVKAVEDASVGEVESKSLPNIEIAYDFGLTKWFSLGLMGTYQSLSLEETVNAQVSTYSVSRIYVGGSFLFHYANSGKLDLYSGIRVGYKDWSASADLAAGATDLEIEDINFFGDGIGFQVMLFGIRGYLTDNIGIYGEVIGIGAPHISSIGLNYRF